MAVKRFAIDSAQSAVRGFHAYKDVWSPDIGENYCVNRNLEIFMIRTSVIVGHVFLEVYRLYATLSYLRKE